jgi:hypothetical protein
MTMDCEHANRLRTENANHLERVRSVRSVRARAVEPYRRECSSSAAAASAAEANLPRPLYVHEKLANTANTANTIVIARLSVEGDCEQTANSCEHSHFLLYGPGAALSRSEPLAPTPGVNSVGFLKAGGPQESTQEGFAQ